MRYPSLIVAASFFFAACTTAITPTPTPIPTEPPAQTESTMTAQNTIADTTAAPPAPTAEEAAQFVQVAEARPPRL